MRKKLVQRTSGTPVLKEMEVDSVLKATAHFQSAVFVISVYADFRPFIKEYCCVCTASEEGGVSMYVRACVTTLLISLVFQKRFNHSKSDVSDVRRFLVFGFLHMPLSACKTKPHKSQSTPT